LIEHDVSPVFFVLAFGLSLAAGALHALGPGHGKSIMAAYLVGTEGRVRHALAVGTAVSLMHTASVVALGLVILGASQVFTPEVVFPWLSLASGLVVVGLGGWLLRTRTRWSGHEDLVRAEGHHDDHSHHHHAHEHAHHHHGLSPGIAPTSWKGLGVIALSGGLLPSPSALVVLLGAVALHRVLLGLVLVGVFSVGLAACLSAVGILVIRVRSYASRRLGERVTAVFPVVSAGAILGIGVILTAGAVARL
jgi:ABC-type nickel/cobalt efflux system permease component RcnA